MSRVAAMYCARGPYRHVRKLIDQGAAWMPWGYRTKSMQQGLELRPGDVVELWEVDDVRAPRAATAVAVATVDFVSASESYLACTLRLHRDASPIAAGDDVVEAVRRGLLLSVVPAARLTEPLGVAG